MPFCWRQFPVISWQLRTIAMLKKEVCHQHKNILHSLSQPIKIKAHQIQMARNTQKVHKGCAKLALTIVKVKATPFIQLFNMSKKIVWKLNVICLIWLIYIYSVGLRTWKCQEHWNENLHRCHAIIANVTDTNFFPLCRSLHSNCWIITLDLRISCWGFR